jgi:hypothetical protein
VLRLTLLMACSSNLGRADVDMFIGHKGMRRVTVTMASATGMEVLEWKLRKRSSSCVRWQTV